MSKSINILDKDYTQWIKELGSRYRQSQIKAAVKVNQEMLRFYWELGRDIVEMHIEERWGEGVIKMLSADLQSEIPGITGVSNRNIYYCKQFYLLYNQVIENLPQVEAKLPPKVLPQVEAKIENMPQVVAQIEKLPQIGEEFENHPQIVDDSRISQQVAAKIMSDVFSIPWGHHKYIIDRCSNNPEKALFFVRQTIETGRDNPTIGLLICKEKDRIQAQYALESTSQPLGISEYELERFYPEKIEGTIPTIEEIETKLGEMMEKEKH